MNGTEKVGNCNIKRTDMMPESHNSEVRIDVLC
jgi:hypothetical protein